MYKHLRRAWINVLLRKALGIPIAAAMVVPTRKGIDVGVVCSVKFLARFYLLLFDNALFQTEKLQKISVDLPNTLVATPPSRLQ